MLLRSLTLAVIIGCAPGCQQLQAKITLPAVLGDHMVIQRDRPIKIWGWAGAGEKVTVTLGKAVKETTATKDGNWEITLPAMNAGGPYEITVRGENLITIKDVLVGEVWFCTGQSNMEMGVVKVRDLDKELASANHPRIRHLTAPTGRSDKPTDNIQSRWFVTNRQTISYTSATAYFFARELQKELDVPVGIMIAAVGGTRIEAWTPGVGVRSVPELHGKDKPQNGDLYNGMIHPFSKVPIRGVIWYQGEGNVGDGMLYYHRMRALIQGWRKTFGQGDFPFYYVQLTPLNWGGKPVTELPEIWEAQEAALQIPHTAMAVTLDIGNIGDAHPKNKQDVGRRLARLALSQTYGKKEILATGPRYKAMKMEGARIRISFTDTHGGLASRDGKPLTWFTIAGKDGKFVKATAIVDGETVVVQSDEVKNPIVVRFAWHQIAQPNLVGKNGLPVSPFRTDRK